MPFATNDDLPDRIKSSVPSKNGKDIMRNTINSQLAAGKSESVAFASAWSALKRAGFKRDGDKFTKRTMLDVVADIPDDIRSKIPSKAGRMLFMAAYNQAYENGASLEVSFARGWSALKAAGFQADRDGDWNLLSQEIVDEFEDDTDKSSPGLSDVHVPTADRELFKSFVTWATTFEKRKKTYGQKKKKTEKVHIAVGDTASVDTLEGRERVKIISINGDTARVALVSDEDKIGEYKLDELQKADVEFTMQADVIKLDEDQRLVYGWASIIEENGRVVVDKQGDVILEQTLLEAAHDYMSVHRKAHEMHEGVNKGETVSSIVFTHDVQKALGIDLGMVGWFICQKIHDDELWKKFKSGELSAFSIGGRGQRTDIE